MLAGLLACSVSVCCRPRFRKSHCSFSRGHSAVCFVCDWIHMGNYFLFLFCPEETLKRTEPNADGSCRCELTCDRHGLLVEFSGLEALDDRMSQISPPNAARPQGRKGLLGWHPLLSGTPSPSDISKAVCYLTGKRD